MNTHAQAARGAAAKNATATDQGHDRKLLYEHGGFAASLAGKHRATRKAHTRHML